MNNHHVGVERWGFLGVWTFGVWDLLRRLMSAAALILVAALAADAPRPNILFVLVDDLRWDDLACTGNTFTKTPHLDRVAREGLMFRNAFATTVICSPSRASILTGLHTYAHGIVDNTDRSAASHKLVTFPQGLQRAGYETAFIGKWHMGNDDSRRPGFDYWVCLKGQGSTNDPELNVNGQAVNAKGYVTDILGEQARAFLQAPHSKPFLLYLSHKAVHPETVQRADGSLSDPTLSNFIPAERHKSLYRGVKVPRRPNASEPPRNKPALQREIAGLAPLGPDTGSSDEVILNRLRMLAAIDEGMGDIFAVLERTGQLDRTMIVVTSDHGYFYGEHGLSVERRLAYEEGIRIPLLVRYPPLVKAGTRRNQMVLTLDFAPTFLDLAGARIPAGMHGKSFLPLLRDNGPALRDAFLVEHFSENVFPRTQKLGYQAVRTENWKYIHYVDLPNADELYDLNRDPFEMRNLIGAAGAAKDLAQLRAQLTDQVRGIGGPAPKF
jgi:N-acetylglucosamine-6-sulfatase